MRAYLIATALALGCMETGCTEPASQDESQLVVFAASSLTEVFAALAADFEGAHPETEVALSVGGSQRLRLQIEQGAPADVFASADARHVDALAGAFDEGHDFATTGLALIVPRSNPAGIEAFADLHRARRIVLGTEATPIGRYARQLLQTATRRLATTDLMAHVASEETSVRLVRAKVELGEADAAIVYHTDVSPRVRSIPIPEPLQVEARYRISGRRGDPIAAAFVAHVCGSAGATRLAEHGFGAPPK